MATASTATAAAAENPQYLDKHITQRPSPPWRSRRARTVLRADSGPAVTRSSAEGQAASALLRVELEKYGCGFPVDVISTIRNQHVALQVWPCAYLHVHALNSLGFAGLDNRTEAGRAARVVMVKEHSNARHSKEKV
jgi:hypothetical protein